MPLASQNPNPIIVYSVAISVDLILVSLGKNNFRNHNLLSQLRNFLFMPYRLLTLESLLIRLGQMWCKSFHLVNLSKSRPIGNIRTHRVRVETIFGGLPCRRSLSPRVSPSRAQVLSCAHLLPCSCYAYTGTYTSRLGTYPVPYPPLPGGLP